MKSIYARILAWLLGTLIVCSIGFIGTNWFLIFKNRQNEPFTRGVSFQLDTARIAYEKGGPQALAAELRRLERFYPGQHYVTDAKGRDLVTGEDRSALMVQSKRPTLPYPFGRLPAVFVRSSPDGRYKFVAEHGVRPDFFSTLPYYLWILVAVAIIAYVLTVNLVYPLRQLRETVDKFGRGDLTARTGSRRKDEYGVVSQAFDRMADRIETLLTAERRLLQDISHELRSPLARLGFSVELARTSDDRNTALNRIKRDIDRLSVLVAELLQVTRVEGDPSSRSRESIELYPMLESLVDDCAMEAEVRHCRLVLRCDEPINLQGDRELLRRALENIVRNAIRHAPERTSIEMRLSRKGDGAVISVRDYGTGVPDEALSEIFKPFYRVDTDRNRASGGVGLGLAIAHRAITLHHGNLEARNMSPGLLMTAEIPIEKQFSNH